MVYINYVIPKGIHPVRLSVAGENDAPLRSLVRASQPAGAYTIYWDRRTDSEAILPPGKYQITLNVGGTEAKRFVRWAQQ
jgi:hypothetical protein